MNHEETIKQLQAQGGYSITHTCLLVRTDESHFAYSDARQALSGLAFLLALVRRAWSSPVVLVGTRNGWKVSERWDTLPNEDQWTGSSAWWHVTTHNILDEFAGPVFDAVGSDEDDAARYGITWYTQVKRTEASVETPLILSQTALELLAWHVAVRHESAFASRRYASEARSCISTTRRPGSPGTGSAPIQDAATTAGRAETSSQR